MARKGRLDRGLLSKADVNGKLVWYVRLYHEGKERRFGSFKTKTQARDFYEKAKQEQKQGRFFPERYQHGGYELVQEMIDRYLTTIHTKKDQRGERIFARWWKDWFKKKRVNHITVDDLERARESLRTKGFNPNAETLQPCSPQRVNRYLAWLRKVLNVEVKQGKLQSNPVKKLTMFKEPKGSTRFLSPDDEQVLMDALGERYARWARLAILTGMRQMEQFSLRWEYVSADGTRIMLPHTKTGEAQHVLLNAEAQGIIEQLKEGNYSVWIFPSQNPQTHMDPRHFYSRVWMPAVKKAKIEWCTWHDLRHTFASRLAMSGQTEGTIATLLRHSSTALVKRYAHLSPTYLQSAVEGVSAFGKAAQQAEQKPTEQPQETTNSNPTVTETGIKVSERVGEAS